jgi:hypothetical protein
MLMRCRECSREQGIGECCDQIDDQTWERIAGRPCDRA